jgi:hypothetical protein
MEWNKSFNPKMKLITLDKDTEGNKCILWRIINDTRRKNIKHLLKECHGTAACQAAYLRAELS